MKKEAEEKKIAEIKSKEKASKKKTTKKTKDTEVKNNEIQPSGKVEVVYVEQKIKKSAQIQQRKHKTPADIRKDIMNTK